MFEYPKFINKAALKGVLIFCIGFGIYVLSNIIFFDTLMPISGMAKQLKISWMPGLNPILSTLEFYPNKLFITYVPIFSILVNISLLMINRSFNKKITLAVILFPFIILILNSFQSTWNLWVWYNYIFFPSLLVSIINISFINVRAYSMISIVLSFILFIWNLTYAFYKQPTDFSIYTNAKDFMRYGYIADKRVAIGDRAGLFTYLNNTKTIQLEGLVMDRTYLDNLQSMTLFELFKVYGVEYYIGTDPIIVDDTTYVFKEPLQATSLNYYITDTVYSRPIEVVSNNGINSFLFSIESFDSNSKRSYLIDRETQK
ncbi:MAG: hypothetical protein Kapaf2KO_12510 [Candidatus Kapaibacteriales bacterium]